jgi:hypothetical protein
LFDALGCLVEDGPFHKVKKDESWVFGHMASSLALGKGP